MISTLFGIKNKIRDIIRKYQEIIFPILRLGWCFLVFTNVHTMFHYVDLFDNKLVIFLLSVLCAVLPDAFLVFAAGAMIGYNCFVVNLEVGLAFSVVFMFMYCVYIRFFPKHAYAIFLVPICYAIGMPYLAPLLILVITGIRGSIPAAFGVALYYFANTVQDIQVQLTTAEDDSKVEILKYFVENFLKNKEMLMLMLVFALTVVAASIIYQLSFPFSHYAAILSGVIFCVVFSIIVAAIFKETADTTAAFTGSFIGFLFCIVMETCKGVLDFPRTERVQFEDDEYYYYVKAVPKLDAPKKKKKRPAEGGPKKPSPEMIREEGQKPAPSGRAELPPGAMPGNQQGTMQGNQPAGRGYAEFPQGNQPVATGGDFPRGSYVAPNGPAAPAQPEHQPVERINRADLVNARRVEETRKARAENLERRRYEEPVMVEPEPEPEDDGMPVRRKDRKKVQLPEDEFEDLG